MKKRIIFVLVLTAFIAMVYADGNAKDVPLKDIEHRILEETEMSAMEKCSGRALMQFIGLDYTQYDSFFYYKGTEALSVDELLIIKGHAGQDLTGVKDAVESRIESQIKTFEGYGPKQTADLKNAIVEAKGDYLFYSVGKASESYKEVFEDVI